MRQLQLLASACIQLMREQAGLKLTKGGLIIAQIYQRFQIKSQNVRGDSKAAAITARGLIERYGSEIEKELNLPGQSKAEGIITVKSL